VADAVGPGHVARRRHLHFRRIDVAVIVELRDAVPQERVGADLHVLEAGAVTLGMGEGVGLRGDDFAAVEVRSGGGGLAGIGDRLEPGGSDLGFRPRRHAGAPDDLLSEPVVRLDARLNAALAGRFDEGPESRLQAQPVEKLVDVVANLRCQLADVEPEGRQVPGEVVALVVAEQFQGIRAPQQRVRQGVDFETVAEERVHRLAEIFSEAVLELAGDIFAIMLHGLLVDVVGHPVPRQGVLGLVLLAGIQDAEREEPPASRRDFPPEAISVHLGGQVSQRIRLQAVSGALARHGGDHLVVVGR